MISLDNFRNTITQELKKINFFNLDTSRNFVLSEIFQFDQINVNYPTLSYIESDIDSDMLYKCRNVNNTKLFSDISTLNASLIPLMVFSIDRVSELKFPIIASNEIDNMIFNSFDEFNTYKYKSDYLRFSTKINFNKIIRIYIFLGKSSREIIPFYCTEINPVSYASKKLYENFDEEISRDYSKSDFEVNLVDDSHFSYEELDITKLDTPQIYEIIKNCTNFNADLNYFTVDIIIDNKGQYLLLNMNGQPHNIFYVECQLYKLIYVDFYQKPLTQGSILVLQNVAKKLLTLSKNIYTKFEIKLK